MFTYARITHDPLDDFLPAGIVTTIDTGRPISDEGSNGRIDALITTRIQGEFEDMPHFGWVNAGVTQRIIR